MAINRPPETYINPGLFENSVSVTIAQCEYDNMKFVSGLLLVAGLAAVNAASSGRILGGTNAPAGSANYHAHLQMRANPTATLTNVGSGTLISPQHILTSATNTQG